MKPARNTGFLGQDIRYILRLHQTEYLNREFVLLLPMNMSLADLHHYLE